MDIESALIPARVLDTNIDNDIRYATDVFGNSRAIAGRRSVKMTIELEPRNSDELKWLLQSLQANGNRALLVAHGSPIIHPTILAPKTDQPKEAGSLIW